MSIRKPRRWKGSHMQTLPYVEAEVRDRRGRVRRKRSAEQMLRDFTHRVQKSGILDEYRERMVFRKPSEKRRDERKLRQYNIDKMNAKRKQRR